MTMLIDFSNLSIDDLLRGYANAVKVENGIDPETDSFIFEYRAEIDKRLELMDMTQLFEFAKLTEKYFPPLDLPIRKTIHYSPTAKKILDCLGFFSRETKETDSDSR